MSKQFFLLYFLFTFFGMLSPCDWCIKWGISENISALKESSLFQSTASSNVKDQDLYQSNENSKDLSDQSLEKPAGYDFYSEYLKQYYPKALIVIDYFYQMCPVAIDAALDDIVCVLSDSEWFYYQNNSKNFSSGQYWEATLYQCYLIDKFLTNASFDLIEEKIYSEDEIFEMGDSGRDFVRLLNFFKKQNMQAHLKFYAEYADRLVKMFNEGIKNFDLAKIKQNHISFSRIVRQLRGFEQCYMYEEMVKTQKELIAILYQRCRQERLIGA